MLQYRGSEPLKLVASTLLESFCSTLEFYLPMYWSSRARIDSADMIRRSSATGRVHGYYIG